MCGSAVANYFVSMCPRSVSSACAFNKLVQLGSVLPHDSAVYVAHWCINFERDGSDLMFCLCVVVCVRLRLGMLMPMFVLCFLHVCKHRSLVVGSKCIL